MAIIYSYPSATPTSNDLLLGTDVDAQGKPTKNYTIKSIIDLIASGATGLGAVLSINNSAKNSSGVNQPINDLTFIKGTLSATFASFLTIGGASIDGTVGTGFTSISSTGATGFTGNLLGVINGGSSLAGTSGPGSTDAENVLGVTQVFTDSSTRIATTAFVQSVATVADLDFRGDAPGVIGSVDLDLQTLDIVGTALNIETSTTAGGQVLTLKLTDDVTIADDLTVTDVLTVSGTGASSTIAGGLQVNNSGGAHAFRVKGQTNDNLIATNYGATDAEDQVAIGKNVADNGTRLDVSGLTQSTTITSTNLLTAGNVKNEGYYEDSNSSSGSNGQVLTSSNVGAGPKTLWVDDPNPTPYEWIVASDFDTGTPPTANTPYTVANGDEIDFVGVGNIRTEWDLASQEVRISAVGDSVTGTGAANQVTYWTGAQTVAGDTGMTYDATANDLTVANIIKADTFTTTAGTATWVTTVLDGFTSITSISTISSPNTLAGFIGDAGASLVPTTTPVTTVNNVQFQGNASTANSLKLSGTVSMSGDTVATGVTYTHGGAVPLVSTISDSVVYNKELSGFNATSGSVQDGDSIIEALERLQGQITTLPQGLVYQGVWSAAGTGGGTPDLTVAGTKVNGHFYICDTAGTAAPNGAGNPPNDWDVRDWVIFADDGAGGGVDEWQKIDNSSLAGGSGTTNTITKWTNNQVIGNSTITDDGSTVTIADTVDFITQGNNTFGNTSADASTFLGNVTLSENLILEKGLSLDSTSTVPYGTAGDVLTSGGGVDVANSWTTPTIGTLTSVGLSETGDALNITNSPLTGAGGVINIAGAGAPTDYINGELNLVAFPALDNYVDWKLQGDSGTNQDITKQTVVDFAGGTKISTATTTDTLTITHAAQGNTPGTPATASPAFGATFTAISAVAVDSTGHLTGQTVKTVTIPSLPTLDNYQYWTLSDGTTDVNISSTNTAEILGGTGITSTVSAADKSVTLDFDGTFPAAHGTQYSLPLWNTATTLDDSQISQNSVATEIIAAQSFKVSGKHLSVGGGTTKGLTVGGGGPTKAGFNFGTSLPSTNQDFVAQQGIHYSGRLQANSTAKVMATVADGTGNNDIFGITARVYITSGYTGNASNVTVKTARIYDVACLSGEAPVFNKVIDAGYVGTGTLEVSFDSYTDSAATPKRGFTMSFTTNSGSNSQFYITIEMLSARRATVVYPAS